MLHVAYQLIKLRGPPLNPSQWETSLTGARSASAPFPLQRNFYSNKFSSSLRSSYLGTVEAGNFLHKSDAI